MKDNEISKHKFRDWLPKILSVIAASSFSLCVPSSRVFFLFSNLSLTGKAKTSMPSVEKRDSIKPTS